LRLRPIKEWEDEPFSYSKLWLALSIWFGLGTFFVIGIDIKGIQFTGLILWAAINIIFQKILKRLVWALVSREFREAIPYDRYQAISGKWIIHSYRDLWRWLRHRNA
jgi:NhaP-type Na+/H+ or K+/H+ antiporter